MILLIYLFIFWAVLSSLSLSLSLWLSQSVSLSLYTLSCSLPNRWEKRTDWRHRRSLGFAPAYGKVLSKTLKLTPAIGKNVLKKKINTFYTYSSSLFFLLNKTKMKIIIIIIKYYTNIISSPFFLALLCYIRFDPLYTFSFAFSGLLILLVYSLSQN